MARTNPTPADACSSFAVRVNPIHSYLFLCGSAPLWWYSPRDPGARGSGFGVRTPVLL